MIRGLKYMIYRKRMKFFFLCFWNEKLRKDFTVVFSSRRRVEEKLNVSGTRCSKRDFN